MRPALVLVAATMFILADEPAAKIEVLLRKPRDKVEVSTTRERALIAVISESGIGGAEIKLTAGAWPKTVVLRLALKELEGFDVESGSLRIHTGRGHEKPEVHLRTAEGEWKVTPPEDRHRISITRVEDRIDIQLPAAIFSEAKAPVRVQWIDYYRG